MRVEHCRSDGFVSKELLHGANIVAGGRQVGRKGAPEPVVRDPFGQTRPLRPPPRSRVTATSGHSKHPLELGDKAARSSVQEAACPANSRMRWARSVRPGEIAGRRWGIGRRAAGRKRLLGSGL